MTPEQQRIAIAEVCGFVKDLNCVANETDVFWRNPAGQIFFRGELPNYLSDLNAMREAEHILFSSTEPLWDAFVEHLYNLGYRGSSAAKYAIHATSSQRAEAFLRTLNLWVD